MDLFGATSTIVVDDAEGGVRYWPEFATFVDAAAWFDFLHQGVNWSQQYRPMYDRVVPVPRLLAAFAVDQIPDHLPLETILARVRGIAPAPYNDIALNLYRNGNDSVAMHSDKLSSIATKQPIALVSLGKERRMAIRAKAGARNSVSLQLAPGSLLVMSHASQQTHEHGIPKTTHRVGPRISVVFRVRPRTWRPEDA